MAKSLIEARKKWEGYPSKKEYEPIGHFTIVPGEAWATVMRLQIEAPEPTYDFIRYFRVGSGVEASVDLHGVEAETMMEHVLEYLQ